MKILSIAVLFLAAVSCSTTDITRNPSQMTDFIVGEVYVLRQTAWIRDQSLLTLRGKEPLDSQGIVVSGTKLMVRRILVERSLKMGTYTDILAEILTGEHKGKTINVAIISQTLKSGYTKRDPEMLEPVEREMK